MPKPSTIRWVRCTYVGWIQLGRARTRCPSCGASLDMTSHEIVELPKGVEP